MGYLMRRPCVLCAEKSKKVKAGCLLRAHNARAKLRKVVYLEFDEPSGCRDCRLAIPECGATSCAGVFQRKFIPAICLVDSFRIAVWCPLKEVRGNDENERQDVGTKIAFLSV